MEAVVVSPAHLVAPGMRLSALRLVLVHAGNDVLHLVLMVENGNGNGDGNDGIRKGRKRKEVKSLLQRRSHSRKGAHRDKLALSHARLPLEERGLSVVSSDAASTKSTLQLRARTNPERKPGCSIVETAGAVTPPPRRLSMYVNTKLQKEAWT